MGTELNNNMKRTASNGHSVSALQQKIPQLTLEIQSYDEPPGVERQYVVKLEDLEHYVKTLSKTGGFKEQYEMLKNGPSKPSTVGKKTENKPKNRYQDLLPYDDCRVVLQKLKNDPHSDYINASYVDSYEKGFRYIATQGPLESTVEDFWRMVWQEDANVICMTANIIESGKKKCEKYWPDKVLKTSEIIVTSVSEMVFLDYTIRNFKLQKIGVSGHRMVRQYQYTAWPDHGVPPYPLSVVMMLKDMKDYQKMEHKRSPWVLHCSAGVGRSGTVMVLNSAIEMSKTESKVDVLGLLYKMRQQRINVIEIVEQYSFVYRALVEYHFGDISCKPASEMVLYFNKLRQTDSETKKTGLELQFEKLRRMEPENFQQKCFSALTPNNKNKNRDPYIIPPDHGRPVLKTNPPSNYINAVYTYDYGKQNHFIVTQYPLPSTIADFWQLLWDSGTCAVVVLNEISNKDEVQKKREQETWEYIRDGFMIKEDAENYAEEKKRAELGQIKKKEEYKRMLDKQRNEKLSLLDVYSKLDEAEVKRAEIFNEAKRDMQVKHNQIKKELEKKKELKRQYVASNLKDESVPLKIKEEENLQKAIRQSDAKNQERCTIKQAKQKEDLASIQEFYKNEMEAKSRRELEEKRKGFQERRKILELVDHQNQAEYSKKNDKRKLEKETQHVQLHQMAKRQMDRREEKLDEVKDYLNHIRSLNNEEEIFQKHAQIEINDCEARGLNTGPMRFAARPGIECGKGPLYELRGQIRPRYYSAIGEGDELNHIDRVKKQLDTKSRLGFILH